MLALVAAPDREDRIQLAEVEEPRPGPGETLVEVHSISLNRGELNRLATAQPGWRPGWDVAGTVIQAAADGSGPREGTRVVVLKPAGAWCERVAVPAGYLAELPAGLGFAGAATLPVAGLTALGTLRIGGAVLGRRVLVTGAAGGVGRFAIQLGRRGGATVTAVAGSSERTQGLADLGASEAVVGLEPLAGRQFDLILESAGGESLEKAIKLLPSGGTLVSFGNSSLQRTTLLVNDFYSKGGVTIYGFLLFNELARGGAPGPDLAFLAAEVAAGRLDPQIALEVDWHQAGSALLALRDRSVAGKAILHLR
ncbi:MAG: zinc-binding dehydrogenase [Candidatus Dormibacteraceae bacterium]